MRYLYDMKNEYLGNYNFFSKKIINFIFFYMKKWDIKSSNSVDLIIANSNFIAERVDKYWQQATSHQEATNDDMLNFRSEGD